MKIAICGYPPLALQLQKSLRKCGIEIKFFVKDFASSGGEGNLVANLPPISFFEFRRLVNAGELDGVIIAEDARSDFTRKIIPLFKLYKIPQVGVFIINRFNPVSPIYWLDTDKAYIATLNTNLIDGCNLNCKGCTHFASLFKSNEIYPPENFRRDVRKLSEIADIVSFALLGGEPLLLKNLDKYILIARKYFPKTNLRILTNGLLIPQMSQSVINALIETKAVVVVSAYPPTLRIIDKIKTTLNSSNVLYDIHNPIQTFGIFMTLHSDNNPKQARKFCAGNDICRFLRDGKIYKCPPDALKYRLAERFGINRLPEATSVDLYASNFSSMLECLDGNVEMCSWCSEQPTRQIPWESTNNPKLEDWLADPDELKNFA